MFRGVVLCGLLSVCASAAVQAATVRVEVVDEDGKPVGRALILLESLDDGMFSAMRKFRRTTADVGGRAEFQEVETGRYRLEARTAEHFHVDAGGNPLARPVGITVDSPEQSVDVRIELHRGTRLCTRFVIRGSRRKAWGRLQRHETETDHKPDPELLEREEERCTQLFAGLWDLRLEPPRGYVLIGLDVNGISAPGYVATLDVRAGSPAQYVTWYLAAWARLEGRIIFKGERFGAGLQAELLEGGPWRAEADARGGSNYTPVNAGPDPTGRYAMDLPDGRWLVTVRGENLEEAEPEQLEIVLARGEHRTQDFVVRGRRSDGTPALWVKVLEPDGDPAADAVVELWPPDPADRGVAPMASQRVAAFSMARFRNLAPGSYRLVAGQAAYMENARTITFDPEDDESCNQSIQLQNAAELNVQIDGEDRARNARIELERIDPPLETELADKSLLTVLRRPGADLDATNRARVRGIYPGSYIVRGKADDRFIEFRQDGAWVEEPELTFVDAQPRELTARLVSAGQVAGSLFCAGAEPLPSLVDIRVIPVSARPRDPLDESWAPQVILERRLLLDGPHRDHFVVSPLDPGSYLLAVRPTTFDRWSWPGGTENGAEAQSLEVARGGAPVELGALPIDCGPAIHVTLAPPAGQPAPSLADIRLKRGLEFSAEVITPDDLRYKIDRPTVEPYERLLVLRGFHEGRVTGEVELRHAYFLPSPVIGLAFDGEFERGRTLAIAIPVPAVGGAAELLAATTPSPAARATDEHDQQRIAPLNNHRATFENLPPGLFQFELCADPQCIGPPLHAWPPVKIEPLQTIELAH